MTNFWANISGNVAITFTMTLPALLMCLGLAVDYGVWINQKGELQGIADQAAFAAASELYLSNATSSQADSVALTTATDSLVESGFTATASLSETNTSTTLSTDGSSSGGTGSTDTGSDAPGTGSRETTFGEAVGVETRVDYNSGSVEVVVIQHGVGFFSKFFMTPPAIRVHAVARAAGGGRICVIGLDPSSDKTIILASDATLTANGCGVFSNSTDSTGLSAYRNANLRSELNCSSGGYGGSAINFDPEPVTDCPPIADPLANRPPPSFGGCDETDFTVSNDTIVLSPGVYCGGLGLYKNSVVTLEPGIYIIKDGPLSVTNNAQVYGEYVGFYLTGEGSEFLFAADSIVRLSAPKDGPMAGLLFYEDRTGPLGRDYEITSEDAGVLTGTIYLPNGRFLVSSKNPVARDSPYTAIVARQIALYRNSSIIINSDYGSTDVPVPSGLGNSGVGRRILLVE